MSRHLTILGGGPAGLAVGFYAARRKIPFTIYEAGPVAGGNCRTLRHGAFRYDSGAHRFHDKLPEVTADVKNLLGPTLQRIDAPSQIFIDGKLISFPLAPLNLLAKLGPAHAIRGLRDFLTTRHRTGAPPGSFEDFAVGQYGRFLADRFLISYSEKLWGIPATQLSTAVSGGRLRGLTVRNAVIEAVRGRTAKSRHLDGSFYYPTHGIGAITDALAANIPGGSLRLNARVTGVVRSGDRVTHIGTDHTAPTPVDQVISTLPIDLMARLLSNGEDGALPVQGTLKYRHVLLIVLLIDAPFVTNAATVYFPDTDFPFTRISEPKIRSAAMAPPDQTSLAIEVPCFDSDEIWRADEHDAVTEISKALATAGFFRAEQVIGHACHRLFRAYPVLERGSEHTVRYMTDKVERFRNLRTVGRNGLFAYVHVHDIMNQARTMMAEFD